MYMRGHAGEYRHYLVVTCPAGFNDSCKKIIKSTYIVKNNNRQNVKIKQKYKTRLQNCEAITVNIWSCRNQEGNAILEDSLN